MPEPAATQWGLFRKDMLLIFTWFRREIFFILIWTILKIA